MPSLRHVVRATVLLVVGGLALPVLAGPDFFAPDRRRPLAASDAHRELAPMDDIVFAFDQAALDPTALGQLAQVTRWLEAHPAYRLVVEGRADSSGTEAYNAALARRRAEIVKNHLVGSGIDPDRILTAVHGENGARPQPKALDRRAVMFASTAGVRQLVTAELGRDAVEVAWTHLGTRLRETRGITPVATNAGDR